MSTTQPAPAVLGLLTEQFELKLIEENPDLKKQYEEVIGQRLMETKMVTESRIRAAKEADEAARLAQKAQGVVHSENVLQSDAVLADDATF